MKVDANTLDYPEVLVSLRPRAVWRATVVNPDTNEIKEIKPFIARSLHGARLHAAVAAGIGVETMLEQWEIFVEFIGYIREKSHAE